MQQQSFLLLLLICVTFQRERDALPQEIFRESVEPEKGGKVITRHLQNCPELSRLDETCSNLSIHLKKFPDLSSQPWQDLSRIVQTSPECSRHLQTRQDLSRLDKTCPDSSRHFQNWLPDFRLVHIFTDLSRLVWTCSDLSRLVLKQWCPGARVSSHEDRAQQDWLRWTWQCRGPQVTFGLHCPRSIMYPTIVHY